MSGVDKPYNYIMSLIEKPYNYIMTCDIENIELRGGLIPIDGVMSHSIHSQTGGGIGVRRGSDMFLFPNYNNYHMDGFQQRLSEYLNSSQEIHTRLDDIKRVLSL